MCVCLHGDWLRLFDGECVKHKTGSQGCDAKSIWKLANRARIFTAIEHLMQQWRLFGAISYTSGLESCTMSTLICRLGGNVLSAILSCKCERRLVWINYMILSSQKVSYISRSGKDHAFGAVLSGYIKLKCVTGYFGEIGVNFAYDTIQEKDQVFIIWILKGKSRNIFWQVYNLIEWQLKFSTRIY